MNDRHTVYETLPAAVEALMTIENAVNTSALDPLLRHLVKLRVSQINGCAFCVAMHLKEARDDGETEKRLDHVVVWPHTDLFSPAEKAGLAWAEALTTQGNGADLNALCSDLQRHFTAEQIDALTLAIVMINNWNRLQIANHNARF